MDLFKKIANAPVVFIKPVYKKVAEMAKKSNVSVKNFLGNVENRDHISLVLYDIMPLAVKLSWRYDKFKSSFDKHYGTIASKILSVEIADKEDGLEEKLKRFDPEKHNSYEETKSVKKAPKAKKPVATKKSVPAKKAVMVKRAQPAKKTVKKMN